MKAVLKKCSSSYISYAGSFTVLSFLFSPSLAGARSSVGGKDKDIDACKSTPESRSTCPTATILSGLAPLKNMVAVAIGYPYGATNKLAPPPSL